VGVAYPRRSVARLVVLEGNARGVLKGRLLVTRGRMAHPCVGPMMIVCKWSTRNAGMAAVLIGSNMVDDSMEDLVRSK
jgi:hypothetical protein